MADVWTTKGNQHAFIGAQVTYLDENWNFSIRHLCIKLVAWHHIGEWLAEPLVATLKKNNLFTKISRPFLYFYECSFGSHFVRNLLHASVGH